MDKNFLSKLKEMTEAGLRDIVKKGQFSSAQDLHTAKNALCLMKYIEEMEGGNSEYSERYYRDEGSFDGGSYRRGRNQYNGRYMSRDAMGHGSYDGYDNRMSGHSVKDRMKAALEDMASQGGEYERQEAMDLLNRLK